MKKVLLVNDSKFESLVMKDALNSMGFEVQIGDENNAIELTKSYNPNYVIANYIMREIRGDQLISIIKLFNRNIKCLICSSNTVKLDQLTSRKIDGVIHTPVDRNELQEIFSKLESEIMESKEEEPKQTKIEEENVVCQCGKEFGKRSEIKFLFCPYCGSKL